MVQYCQEQHCRPAEIPVCAGGPASWAVEAHASLRCRSGTLACHDPSPRRSPTPRRPCLTTDQSFTERAWFAISSIRGAIEDHPFLRRVRDGTLPGETFASYLAQDAHYLTGYAKALSRCAAQARSTDEIAFWVSSAHEAIVVERSLHAGRLHGLSAAEPSPTCTAYTSF